VGERVAYKYAGETHRRFIEAVERAQPDRWQRRVAFALAGLIFGYSKVEDTFTISQVAKLLIPDRLAALDPSDYAAYRAATKPIGRALNDLARLGLISYQPARGSSPRAWVSMIMHAPEGVDSRPSYAREGSTNALPRGLNHSHKGAAARPLSEKSEKSSKTETYEQWESEDQPVADFAYNAAMARSISDGLRKIGKAI